MQLQETLLGHSDYGEAVAGKIGAPFIPVDCVLDADKARVLQNVVTALQEDPTIANKTTMPAFMKELGATLGFVIPNGDCCVSITSTNTISPFLLMP